LDDKRQELTNSDYERLNGAEFFLLQLTRMRLARHTLVNNCFEMEGIHFICSTVMGKDNGGFVDAWRTWYRYLYVCSSKRILLMNWGRNSQIMASQMMRF